ncbi:MAG TPA: ABC transporter ATP-binding protein [Steroidobacteraceae bacterium]|nr:ABC transporter ATP-binding protein [Steroidobacteraceae bacterium]
MALLEIRELTVDFAGPRPLRAVDGVSLDVGREECLAIVGESGSGKTQLLLACVGLLAANGRAGGSARFEGRELIGAGDRAARVRGRGIGFVFQDAGGSLTPHLRIGEQLAEAAVAAHGVSRESARAEGARMLERVRLPDAARRMAQYPHELSGGMRQRAAIALALMPRPQLLFADEPTTALDVTVQAEVVTLLATLCRDLGMALLLVTHDLGIVASLAGRVAVMYAGRIVELADAERFLRQPRHPYGAGLLAAVPTLATGTGSLRTIAGAPPWPGTVLPGCRFEPRCERARELCRREDPALSACDGGQVACHFPVAGGPRS